MKFYVHCEDPEMTMVIKWENLNGKVSEMAEIVKTNMEKKFPSMTSNKTTSVFKIRGNILNVEDIVMKKIKNLDDVSLHVSVTMATQESGKNKDSPVNKNIEENVKEYLSLAESFVEKHRTRRAILLYQDVIQLDNKNETAYLRIADCYLKAKRPQKALLYIKKLQKLKITNTIGQIEYRLGQCYVGLGEADKAIEILQKHCVDLRKSGGGTASHKHQVQLLLSKAYMLKEEKDMALVILQGILREDKTYVEALTEYASLIYPLGPAQSEEAMTVLLTLVANNRNDSYIKEKFSWVCQQPLGLKILESVAGRAWSDIASLVFIATSIREYGAIEEALAVMKHAYGLKKSEAHTLLTYVHMLELTEQQSDAMKLVKQYIEDFPDHAIGSFKCRDLQPITKFLTSDKFFSEIEELPEPGVTKDTANENYDEDEKYLLALLHTLVKILYVKGCLGIVSYLTNLLDPLSVNRDLHLTNIRNEAAYFTCISQVVKTSDRLHTPQKEDKVLYFVGDSHCITPAWQQIQFREELYTIHPVLSTGTKIWHLRDESKFYPKINFNNAIKVIPSKAVVILCFGEIDCREAFLMCVEKAKYESLDEVIDKVIDIYISVIKKMVDRYEWDIYVHPVMPVLDITRSIVMPFNSCLKCRIQKEKRMRWLDFVDDLIYKDDDGNLHVKNKYRFDGTHIHPSYTALLQRALAC